MLFRGIGAAPGLALANCLIIHPLPAPNSVVQSIPRDQVAAELELFSQAVKKSIRPAGSHFGEGEAGRR